LIVATKVDNVLASYVVVKW